MLTFTYLSICLVIYFHVFATFYSCKEQPRREKEGRRRVYKNIKEERFSPHIHTLTPTPSITFEHSCMRESVKSLSFRVKSHHLFD